MQLDIKINKAVSHSLGNAVLFVVLCALLVNSHGRYACAAEPAGMTEYRVVAGLLYNFTLFVSWPKTPVNDAAQPFNICVADMSELGDAFDVLSGKRVNGRPIVLRGLRDQRHAPGECQIVFLNTDDKNRIREILAGSVGKGVLAVGQTDGFTELGGVINIVRMGAKFGLEINVPAAKRAGL
ncbi:MAG: YfiR family protein, partial [Deltaproteobacteria bacterium]|nr:YfiR family protein [Deltaproteobacteria bacterium]